MKKTSFSGIKTLKLQETLFFQASMIKNRFRKVVYLMPLFFGIYCLWRINLFAVHGYLENSIQNLESNILEFSSSLPSKLIGKKLPFHQVYEPRQIRYPTDLQEQSVFPKKTKVILLWTPWNGVENTINFYSLQLGNRSFVKYKCPNQKCITTRDRKYLKTADAVLFHLLDTKSTDLPSYRNAEQLWILYNMEPPWLIKRNIHQDLPHLKNTFNWTMSYRSNSDIIARYGFIAPSSRKTNNVTFSTKTKDIVWFVSDCKTDSRRESYVKELSKYINIDIYGTCGTHKCYPSQSATCYEKVLQKYKFYLSFENAICKDYITEKYFNVFNYDIIPIVFGGANYASIIPDGTFIDATEYPDPKTLAIKLRKISSSEDLYRTFLENKASFLAYLDPWMCRLCDKLHTSHEFSTLRDVEEWWLKEAQCKTWNRVKKKFERSI